MKVGARAKTFEEGGGQREKRKMLSCKPHDSVKCPLIFRSFQGFHPFLFILVFILLPAPVPLRVVFEPDP